MDSSNRKIDIILHYFDNNKERVVKILLFTILFYYSSCTGLTIDGTSSILMRNIALLLLTVYSIIKHKLNFERIFKIKQINIWYILSLFIIVSVFPVNIFEGVKFLLAGLVYFTILSDDKYVIMNISIAEIINGIIIITKSIQANSIIIEGYRGIYTNSNTMGAAMAALFVSSLVCFLMVKKTILKIMLIAISCISFYLTLMTYCRTALLSCIIVLLLTLLYILRNYKTKINFIINFLMISVAILLVVIYFSDFIMEIKMHTFKWENETDLSSNRIERWEYVFNNFHFWGTTPIFAPHNNFVATLYYYGVIPFVALVYFVISCFFVAVKNYRERRTLLNFVVFFYIILFVIQSQFEESLGLTGREWMCLFFLTSGYVFFHKEKESEVFISEI